MTTMLEHDPSVSISAGGPGSPVLPSPTDRSGGPNLDPPNLDPPNLDPPNLDPPLTTAPPDLWSLQRAIEHAPRGDVPEVLVLSEAELVDQIGRLESLQHAIGALQADRIRTFARLHAAGRVELEGAAVDPRALERSTAAQIGLACRISPTRGRTRLHMARTLRSGLDHVRDLFTSGELSVEKAAAVVAGTADLDDEERARLDDDLTGHDLARLGLGRLRDLVRTLAARIAPEKFRARAAAARQGRRVTLRPGEDGMCWLTAHLPVEQGAACLAALARAVADRWSDPTATVTRSRGQAMADTLVERATGQAAAEKVDAEIQAILPVEALIDPDAALPARIPGLGLVAVERLLSTRAGRLGLRRLVTREGVVVGGDSRQRSFTGVLADLIRARDGHRCREPYCDAPIRHIDHIRRRANGGPTSTDNGRGVCEFHNYVREQAGWDVRGTAEGVRTTTPTGHVYVSPVPRAA